ncbi:hypothetical protein N8592_00885 [Verrucomicrobia bacterium]|nr:hypothetical protein [Verrucomicrobiota bacterium]
MCVSLVFSQRLPSGRLIAGSLESLKIDKSLRQQYRNSEVIKPIIMESLANQFEYLGSEVGLMASGGKNQKTTVLGNKMSSFPDHVGIPPQQLITRFEMQAGGTERQGCNPLPIVYGDVTKDLADSI